MRSEDYDYGDIGKCPHCGKEYLMDNLDEEDYNDFDRYFQHVTVCGRSTRGGK